MIIIVIYLQIVIWFRAFIFHFKNDQKNLLNPYMGPQQILPLWVRVETGVIAMKEYSALPRHQNWSLMTGLFSDILRTEHFFFFFGFFFFFFFFVCMLMLEVCIPSAGYAVGVLQTLTSWRPLDF